MGPECQLMHIDCTHEVAMPAKPADTARPRSALRLVTMPTYRTPAACASFGAGEAHDVRLCGFVGEVVDVFPVFPQGHALVMMPRSHVVAHAMGIANEERSYFLLHTEVDHLSGRLMPQITDAPFSTSALLVLRSLQVLPTARILLAPGLLFCDLPQVPIPLPFERADAASGDDQRLAGTGRDSGQVYLAQIYGSLYRSRSVTCLRHFYAYMQFKAVVPHQRSRPTVLRQIKRQNKRWPASAHRQDHTPVFSTHGLSRPMDRIEALGSPGIFHLHVRMLFAQFACRLDGAREGTKDGLHRLAM